MTDTITAHGPRIDVPNDKIRDFSQRHHIRLLALFGSVIRDDFASDSDIDVLVEFEPGSVPGLQFFAMQDELSRILGRTVDLNTPGFLSRHMRDDIRQQALVLYDKT